MGQPFVGEVKMIGFGYAPKYWAFCNGQILPIAQNQALFALLGTTYGGDGQTTYALPDLRGRTPIHYGQGPGLPPYTLGQVGGESAHTLTISELPAHNHLMQGTTAAASAVNPANNAVALQSANPFSATPNVSMNASALSTAGGSQPHNNMQPYQVINFIIALQGAFPSRS